MSMYIKPFFFFLTAGHKVLCGVAATHDDVRFSIESTGEGPKIFKSTLEIVYFSCFSAASLMPGIWLLGLK